MAPRKTSTATLHPVKVCTLALKQVKSASDYHQIGSANTPETLTTAWSELSEQDQQRIIDLVNANTQPDPRTIADELMACGTLIQLQATKASYGDVAVKAAWKLLPPQERDRIHSLCDNGQKDHMDNVVQMQQIGDLEGNKHSSAEEVQPMTEQPANYQVEPPTRKPNLIELTTELEQLDDLLETMDGDIPVELQHAVDALLAQRDATHDAVLEKIDNYCGLIQSRLMWAAARKAEADRLAKLAEVDFKTVDFLRGRLKEHLEATDQKKLRTKRFNISIRTAGGKQALRLNVESPEQLPHRFQRVAVEPDNQLLRQALEEGDLEAKEVAYLAERSTYVAIN
jgi:hypothetical protein